MQTKIYKKGFTLAEILITLLIIGVVASITVPSIINETQQAEFKTAWKKNYALLDQASKMLMVENGGTIIGVITSSNDMKNKFQNYLSYNKSCNTDTGFGTCWHNNMDGSVKFIDGEPVEYTIWGWGTGSSGIPALILNNGTLVAFGWGSTSCTNNFFQLNICGQIFVDINGFKAPNTIGKDIYCSYLTSTGLKPCGMPGDNYTLDNRPRAQCFTLSRYYLYQ